MRYKKIINLGLCKSFAKNSNRYSENESHTHQNCDFHVTFFISVFATTTPSVDEDVDVPNQYVIPGQVMENEFALVILARQSELTYQLKLAEYQNELAASIPDILPEFENRDVTIVGSIVTMDAGIYFYEGIKNLQVIAPKTQRAFLVFPTH